MFRVAQGLLIALVFALGTSQRARAQTPSTRADEPEKFAVLVGVGAQKSSLVRALKGPRNDVRIMRDLLVRTYHFKDDADHITVLTDKDATVAGIRDAFRRQLIDRAKAEKARGGPEPIVVFYYSGHGSVITDHNNDEGDGLDETFVAYDSRARGGVDLIDDEVDLWFDELRTATSNVTFILDSCHSGTATRDPGKIARELPPNPNMGGAAVRARGGPSPASPDLLKVLQFTAVAGALASESSYEGDDIPGANNVWHGYLTWSLVQTLRQRPDISWRQALALVRLGMADIAPGQHPQVEGDIDRMAFGGAGDQAQAYITLEKVTGDTVTIGAGEPQGLAPGSTVAVYDSKARLLRGPTMRLATARVTEVGVAQSKAVVTTANPPALPLDSKVAILSLSSKAKPLTIKLDTLPDQATTVADRTLLAKVRDDDIVKTLSTGGKIRLVAGAEPYLYAIQRGCLDAMGILVTVDRGEPTAGCRAAYYVATRQSRRPLFAYHVAADDRDVVRRLADAVDRLENQADLRSQVNDESRLKLSLRLMDVTTLPTGGLKITPRATDRIAALKIGQDYTFEMKNLSSEDIYVTFLVAGTSGAVIPLTASANGDLLKPGVAVLLKGKLTAGGPAGLETYKLLASTNPQVNFRHWVRSALRTRDPGVIQDLQVDDWTTAQLDIQIEPAP